MSEPAACRNSSGAEPPVIQYATQEVLIPRPVLAAVGFALFAVYELSSGSFFLLLPWIEALNISEYLLTIGSIVVVLSAFRRSPLWRNWLHYSLAVAITAKVLLYVACTVILYLYAPGAPARPGMLLYVLIMGLFHFFDLATVVLWMLFLPLLGRAMHSRFLCIATLILFTPRVFASVCWTVISLSASGLTSGSWSPEALDFMSDISMADYILTLLIGVLFAWYAIAVYRFSRKERHLVASA